MSRTLDFLPFSTPRIAARELPPGLNDTGSPITHFLDSVAVVLLKIPIDDLFLDYYKGAR